MASINYRPPWPDELSRAGTLLGQRAALGPGWHPRVWEAARPARFVGAAGWFLDSKEKGAQVSFNLLPRYAAGSPAVEMLRPLFAEVAAAGAREAQVAVRQREKWEELLGGFGLKWERCDEQWMLDSMRARERLAASRLPAHPAKMRGWTMRPLAEADWEFVRAWGVAPGHLSSRREEFLRAHHAPEISGAVESPHGVEGVLVASLRGLAAAVEFVGANPARLSSHPLAAHLLFRRLFASEAPAPPFDALAIMFPSNAPAVVRNLAKRFGAAPAAMHHHFRGKIKIPS